MTLNLSNEQESEPGFDFESAAFKVAQKVLDEEKCPYEAEISLVLVTPEVIKNYNREYRGIDSVTDVLSFPSVPFESPADFGILDDHDSSADYFDPDTGELFLGDIVINVERAEKQAEEYGHTFLREYSFLVAHSMLHLLGYDHMTDDEASVMEEKQRRYLEELGITRDPGISDGHIRTDKH